VYELLSACKIVTSFHYQLDNAELRLQQRHMEVHETVNCVRRCLTYYKSIADNMKPYALCKLLYQYCCDMLYCCCGCKQVLIIGGGIANFTDVAATFTGIISALRQYADELRDGNIRYSAHISTCPTCSSCAKVVFTHRATEYWV
jgi:hypothetical protein